MQIITRFYSKQIFAKAILTLFILLAMVPATQALALVESSQREETFSVSGMVAKATFTLGSPCSPYTLDWGDGTEVTQEAEESVFCIQMTQEITLKHTYETKGSYDVVLAYGGQTITQALSVPVKVVTFDLTDVQSVTSLWVDPDELMADEEYTLYTITLTDGSVIIVNAGGFTTKEWRIQQFVEAGYRGDMDALTTLAIEKDPVSSLEEREQAEQIKMKERIIELLQQIIALLKVR